MKPFVLATIGNRLYWEYVESLQGLNAPPDPIPFAYIVAGGFDPAKQLYDVVAKAVEEGAPAKTTGILFVEQDHAFTKADVVTLLEFAEAHPGSVCGGRYGFRQDPAQVVGRRLQEVSTRPPAWESDFVGFGFTYTPWSVYSTLSSPWFNSVWEVREGRWCRINPDEFFSMCCKAAGIPLYVLNLPTLTHAFEPGQRPLPEEV